MNEPQHRPRTLYSHWMRFPLVVVILLLVAFVSWRYTVHRRIEAKLDDIREEGYPVTLVDLEEWYPDSKDGNAATIYWQAFTKYTQSVYMTSLSHEPKVQLLTPEGPINLQSGSRFGEETSAPGRGRARAWVPSLPARYEKLPLHGEPISDEAKHIIAEWLKLNSQSLGHLHLAASIRGCRYPIVLADGVNTELPHLRRLWDCSRLIQVEALYHADNLDAEKAVGCVVTSLAIGRSLANEPFPESQFFHSFLTCIALEALQSVLSSVAPDNFQINQLQDACVGTESSNAWFRTMQCERARMNYVYSDAPLMVFDQLEGQYPALQWYFFFGVYRTAGLLQTEHLWALDYLGRVADAMRQPYPQRLKAAAEIDAQYAQETRGKMLARMYEGFGTWPKALDRVRFEGKAVALRRIAMTALAIERWRLRKGELPQKLDDLVTEFLESIPPDPFDGLPLRYKKLTKGYVVYSVGADGIDNGGFWQNWNGARPMLGRDITFTVER
ncbi:MAG: hypothetical protein EXS18_07275 [Verrucomicrobiae bacterium]|nr:hypothetical protein [Verrucomicrobiae bacterium]